MRLFVAKVIDEGACMHAWGDPFYHAQLCVCSRVVHAWVDRPARGGKVVLGLIIMALEFGRFVMVYLVGILRFEDDCLVNQDYFPPTKHHKK